MVAGVVVGGDGEELRAIVDRRDIVVADDPAVPVLVLGQDEVDLDGHPLRDRRLLGLQARQLVPVNRHRPPVDSDVDVRLRTALSLRFGVLLLHDPLLSDCEPGCRLL